MPNNNPKGGAQWAPAHIDALCEYLSEPGQSFSQIADLLNGKFGTAYTRNSTIGKASRLGLKSLNPSGVTFASKKPRQPRKSRAGEKRKYVRATHNSTTALRIVREVAIEQLRCVEVVPQHVALLDLTGCAYPYGDGPFTFCNHEKFAGSSYCPKHHFLCWVPPRVLYDRVMRREAA